MAATTAVRSLFGRRLASVYAPAVVAAFGLGKTCIQIRVVAPDGAVAYRNALRADLLARKVAGAQLLRNKRIRVSHTARRQLAAGQVDTRLLTTIAAVAHLRVLRITGFSDSGPDAAAGTPLRWAELAAPRRGTRPAPAGKAPAGNAPAGKAPDGKAPARNLPAGSGTAGSATAGSATAGSATTAGRPAASPASTRFIRSVLTFLRAQRPPYLASILRAVMVGGRPAVQIGFAGPSPLGLLSAGGASTETSP